MIVDNMLLNGNYSPATRTTDPDPPTSSPALPASGLWIYFPIFPVSNAIETTYTIIVQSLRGAPTSATLKAKWQLVQQTTQGTATSSYFTDARPAFFDVTDATLMPDGAWPTLYDSSVDTGFTDLATQSAAGTQEVASTGGKACVRRIRGGFGPPSRDHVHIHRRDVPRLQTDDPNPDPLRIEDDQ
jgi:hypothetical protein